MAPIVPRKQAGDAHRWQIDLIRRVAPLVNSFAGCHPVKHRCVLLIRPSLDGLTRL